MKRLLVMALALFGCAGAPRAHAVLCNIAAGSSVARINRAIQGARAGACRGTATANTVALAAGSYAINAQIAFPCTFGSQAVILTGPMAAIPAPGRSWGSLYTALLQGPAPDNFGFNVNCSNVTIEYLEWNGNRPVSGGGGAVYVAPGLSNITITHNYLHGFQAYTPSGPIYESAIWFDGTDTSDADYQTQTNLNVSWNQIGPVTIGDYDCSNWMNIFRYNGVNYDHTGGSCGAIVLQATTNGALFANNRQWQILQAYHYIDGSTPTRNGVQYYYSFLETNVVQEYNDIAYCHRNCTEAQGRGMPPVGLMFRYNDMRDAYNPGFATMGYSLPSCCGGNTNKGGSSSIATPNNTWCLDNLAIANVPPPAGNALPEAFELFSDSSCDHNLIQGLWAVGIDYGYSNGGWTTNYNVIQLTKSTHYIEQEFPNSSAAPSMAGNVNGQTLKALVSAAPTISPAPAAVANTITVTLTDTGFAGTKPGPRANTGIYYTTDGSMPTTLSSWCYQMCSFPIHPGTTVKAMGMWGAQNQPTRYATGYGFVPSAVHSWYYAKFRSNAKR